MKICPICKARCFDDMEICYGCMHQFDLVEANGETSGKSSGPDDVPLPPQPSEATKEPVGYVPVKQKPAHREPPRVFGATEVEETMREPWTRGEEAPSAYARADTAVLPQIEPMVGRLAVAALGNGYRLVVSIERD